MSGGKKRTKTKYEQLRVEEKLTAVTGWALHGGEKAVAKALGVSRNTVTAWKGKYPRFADAIADGVNEANGQLLMSAFDLARGFYRPVQEVMKVRVQKYDEEADRILVVEEERVVEFMKYFPPDARMTQFLLNNRMRADYAKDPTPEEKDGNVTIVTDVPRSGL